MLVQKHTAGSHYAAICTQTLPLYPRRKVHVVDLCHVRLSSIGEIHGRGAPGSGTWNLAIIKSAFYISCQKKYPNTLVL